MRTRIQMPEASGSNSFRCGPPLTIRDSAATEIGVELMPLPLLVRAVARAVGATR